jgi:polyhydroxyalkanoate synthesis repressor PhaR
MAILIKRYANRKLYNTETSRYITLKGIAKLLDGGEEVRVIDKETGEDITQVALSQILVDNQRAKEDPSDTLLTQILSRGGDALYGAIKKSVDDASDGLGEFQDRFKTFVSESEAVARGERGFSWDSQTDSERRSPFSKATRRAPGPDEAKSAEQSAQKEETQDSSEKDFASGWPRISGFPDLLESIQTAVTQSVAQAVSEVLDARDLAHAADVKALNERLIQLTQAIERLESKLDDSLPPNVLSETES